MGSWRLSSDCRTTIRRLLAKRDVETLQSMTREDVARAVEMYGEALSSVDIGAKLGFDSRTVIRELRKVGVTIRAPVA